MGSCPRCWNAAGWFTIRRKPTLGRAGRKQSREEAGWRKSLSSHRERKGGKRFKPPSSPLPHAFILLLVVPSPCAPPSPTFSRTKFYIPRMGNNLAFEHVRSNIFCPPYSKTTIIVFKKITKLTHHRIRKHGFSVTAKGPPSSSFSETKAFVSIL